ncbi:MAG: class I SAM-dependent methyltransferase [Candidatus Rokuibacteriota bacterium]
MFPIVDGIPALLTNPPDSPALVARTRSLDAEAARYVFVMAALALLARAWPPAERRRLIAALGLKPGERVLDHCSGPGGNLPAIAARVGTAGTIVAMDLSREMLRRARRWAARRRVRVDLHQADAVALPYADGFFDAVVHVGAINQLGEATPRVVAEMVRVTRAGGVVAIVDEGLEPVRAQTRLGRLLIRRNALFASRPPLDALPPSVQPEVRWGMRGIFYQIVFRTPAAIASQRGDR